MYMGLVGMMKFFHGKASTVLDVVPCDFVSNQIIVQTVYTAMQGVKTFNVAHSCTSVENPINLKRLIELIYDYDRVHPLYCRPQNRKVKIYHVHNVQLWKFFTYMTTEMPL